MPAWTDEQIAELKELAAKGYSSGAIAQLMHFTRNAIIGKRNRLGLPQVQTAMRVFVDYGPQYQNGSRPQSIKPVLPGRVRRRPERIVTSRGPYRKRQPPTVIEPAAAGTALNISLMDLEPHHCRYPLGEAGAVTFCGCHKMFGFSYCEAHVRSTRRDG